MERKIRRCVVCGSEYKFCPRCNEDADKPLWYFTFCAEQCKNIYNITSGYEDGKITIKCSPASRIYMGVGCRRCVRVNADNELLREATFEVKDNYGYVRITVEDEKGRHANTNAYFVDELKK